jgi:hypothetical protein
MRRLSSTGQLPACWEGVKEPDKLRTDGAHEQLYSLLQGSELQWWGTFDELVGGSTEFARAVRDAFWSNEDDEGFDDGDPERPTRRPGWPTS